MLVAPQSRCITGKFLCALWSIDWRRETKGDLVIPSQLRPEYDRTRSTGASPAHRRPRSTRGRQDRTASDRDRARGNDRDTYDSSSEVRERTIEVRRMTADERHRTASARDTTASERDVSAAARDRAAEARDLVDDEWDARIASLDLSYGTTWRRAFSRSWKRPERDRQRAASDRARSALPRADAGADRARAARDRALAASDRVLAAEDRVQAAAELKAGEVDELTGARRRAPGLADIQREIDRANRGDGQLIAVYVDVDGLKATNDSKGHHAGDLMLKHIVDVMRTQLRSYEPVVRVGGDEFVCTISGTTLERARERFARIIAQLSLTPDGGSITVGLARLVQGDSPMTLIDRADAQLLAAREARNQTQRTRSA